MMKEAACATQLICGNGEFNDAALNSVEENVKFDAVVSIIGPQGSGKSTLLNHLFHTRFQEMKIECGQSQTTKGIWIAKCVGIEPCTIALDVEGSDSSERGENETFEKQVALFALAVSDILLINMWYHETNRQQAASKPLLKTIFQEMMSLFTPPKKTTLIVVVRDKPSKAPFEPLENRVRKVIEEMWDAVSKPQAHKNTQLDVIFNVRVVALSNYVEKEETFKEEVAQLRQSFVNSTSPGGLVGDRNGFVPASGFSHMWRVIKLNKNLDLPPHKVMVATVRCEEISTNIFKQLIEDEEWLALKEDAQTGLIPDFGRRLSSILDTYLSEYDKKALYYDEGVRNSERQILESKALDHARVVYTSTALPHLCSKALGSFKLGLDQSLKNGGQSFDSSVRTCTQFAMNEFDQGCADAPLQLAKGDISSCREKLRADMDEHESSVYSAKWSELRTRSELIKEQVHASLTKEIGPWVTNGGKDVWASIRNLTTRTGEDGISKLSTAMDDIGFALDKYKISEIETDIRHSIRHSVVKTLRDEAAKVLIRMNKRFSTEFTYDSNRNARRWTGNKQIRSVTKDARSSAFMLLSDMAVIRLDNELNNVEELLFSCLLDGVGNSTNALAASTWEGVSSEDTIFTPAECKDLWEKFLEDTAYLVRDATSDVEAHKRHKKVMVITAIGTAATVASLGVALIGLPPVFLAMLV